MQAVNDPPIAYNIVDSLPSSDTLFMQLSGYDIDEDSLQFMILNNPEYGFLIGNAPTIGYIPSVNFTVNDTFSFVVSDGVLLDTGYVFLNIFNPNVAPNADAGEDIFALQGMEIVLDGSGSFDSNGDSLSYFWTSSNIINLVDSLSKNTIAEIPYIDINSDTVVYVALRVYDGQIFSNTDTINIFISALTDDDFIADIPLDSVVAGTDVDVGISLPDILL